MKQFMALVALTLGTLGQTVQAQDVAKPMSSKQYFFFLDQLDSMLPLLQSHFQQLCADPNWRREPVETRELTNKSFEQCRELSTKMIGFLGSAIKAERIRPRLSVEYKMQYSLSELLETAVSENSVRPYYDQRSEDIDFIYKNLSPLVPVLYAHVFASISDDPGCGSISVQ